MNVWTLWHTCFSLLMSLRLVTHLFLPQNDQLSHLRPQGKESSLDVEKVWLHCHIPWRESTECLLSFCLLRHHHCSLLWEIYPWVFLKHLQYMVQWSRNLKKYKLPKWMISYILYPLYLQGDITSKLMLLNTHMMSGMRACLEKL